MRGQIRFHNENSINIKNEALLGNMTFKSTSYYKKSMEIPSIIKDSWKSTIKGQLLIELNRLLDSNKPLNGGFTLIHNGRTNIIKLKHTNVSFKSNIDYIYSKYVFHADIFNIDKTINKEYYNILVNLMLNNITRIS